MTRKRRKLLFLLDFLLLLVGLPFWWLHREIQHERDNAALIAAIKRNDTEAALKALERGADANARDLGAIQLTIGKRFRQLWDTLTGRKPAEDHDGKPTAILLLLEWKWKGQNFFPDCPPENTSILQALLQRGANPNVIDQEKLTPLHRAALADYPGYVSILVQHGANIHAKDKDRQTPLHLAANRSGKSVRLLLDAGADPNAVDKDGDTPLMRAALWGNLDAVRLLVAKSAEVNAKGDLGRSPLHWAALNERVDTARFLLEHGADMNAEDNNQETPLSCAQRYSNTGVIRLLKQHGAK